MVTLYRHGTLQVSHNTLEVEESGLCVFAAATKTLVSITAYIILWVSFFIPVGSDEFFYFFIAPLMFFLCRQLLYSVKGILRSVGL